LGRQREEKWREKKHGEREKEKWRERSFKKKKKNGFQLFRTFFFQEADVSSFRPTTKKNCLPPHLAEEEGGGRIVIPKSKSSKKKNSFSLNSLSRL
jgi:hypothetical protein